VSQDGRLLRMEYRRCGLHGPMLSALGLGCWQFGGGAYWGPCDQRDADAVVRRAVDLGINYVDAAEAYNQGRSEEALGRALKGVPRDRLLVGTKVSPSNCYAATLPEHCEASLRRLGLETIDVYMIHWPIHPHSIRHFTNDEATIQNPPRAEEAFTALRRLRDAGKICYVGVSNFGCERLAEAVGLFPDVVVNQLPYNLLMRAMELQSLPQCMELGLGVISYMTLMQGVLTDRYANLAEIPPYQRRTRHFSAGRSELARHGGTGAEEETAAALAEIRRIASACGLATAEVATKWALAKVGISCCLVGARRPERLDDAVEAAATPLPAGALEELDRVTRPVLEALGPGFDYYESAADDRTR